MSSDTPAGNPERVPAALIVKGDSLATLRRIGAALPALREAAGRYAATSEQIVAEGQWAAHRDAAASIPLLAPAVALGDALALAEVCKATLRAEADAADRAAVERVALAVARSSHQVGAGPRALPERAEIEIEIADALDPASQSHDWQRDAAIRRQRIAEARGDAAATAPWICLYTLDRIDGGPEEGGWHYDWREPVAAFRTADYGDPRDARAAAEAHARDRGFNLQGDKDARPVWSVCAFNRVNAIILPAPFPFADASTERPRYE